jgi:GAF domain-containing protein
VLPSELDGDPTLTEVDRRATSLRQSFAGIELTRQLIDEAIETAKGDAGCIYLLSADAQSLRQVVSRNIPAELMTVELRVGQGVSGMAAASRASQCIDDYPSHPLAREPFLSHDLRSVFACPLLSEDHLVGVLCITSHTAGHRFGPREVRVMELIGLHLARVIRAAQLMGRDVFAS